MRINFKATQLICGELQCLYQSLDYPLLDNGRFLFLPTGKKKSFVYFQSRLY